MPENIFWSLTLNQELEQERIAQEKEKKEKGIRLKKIKETFADPNPQWEKDKNSVQDIAEKEKAKKLKNEEVGSEITVKDPNNFDLTKTEEKENKDLKSTKDSVIVETVNIH